MSRRHAIVIAWRRPERRAVDFDSVRIDLGERPKWEDVTVPAAVVWLNAGAESDIAKAEAHAETLGLDARVFAYPVGEKDPLGRARTEIGNAHEEAPCSATE